MDTSIKYLSTVIWFNSVITLYKNLLKQSKAAIHKAQNDHTNNNRIIDGKE